MTPTLPVAPPPSPAAEDIGGAEASPEESMQAAMERTAADTAALLGDELDRVVSQSRGDEEWGFGDELEAGGFGSGSVNGFETLKIASSERDDVQEEFGRGRRLGHRGAVPGLESVKTESESPETDTLEE